MIFNDMININVRGLDAERTAEMAESRLIENCVRWVAELRARSIPIFWIRVERRADRKDRVDALTDAFISRGQVPHPPVTKGSYESLNIDELPIQPEDHEILKPRFNPFIGTDLDLQLRARAVNTIFLGGISTSVGVESCARTAHDLDYNVVVVRDCCFQLWAPEGSDRAVAKELHDSALDRNLPKWARVMTTGQAIELLA